MSPIRLTEARQTTALSRIGTRAARAVTDSGISHRKDQSLNYFVIRRVRCIFNFRGLGTLSARIESHCVPLFCLCLPREFSSSAGASLVLFGPAGSSPNSGQTIGMGRRAKLAPWPLRPCECMHQKPHGLRPQLRWLCSFCHSD